MNDVYLRPGNPFPYNVDEFYTFLEFGPNAMYFLFETEEEYKMTPSHYQMIEDDEEPDPYNYYYE